MKVRNIYNRLDRLGANPLIRFTAIRKDGYRIELIARVGNYYDIEHVGYIDAAKAAEAREKFMDSDTDSFSSKPHHDENDPATDYCAWSFHSTINALDRLYQSASERWVQ